MNKLELSIVALLASTAVSFGASYTWNGGSNDWSSATNWIPNGVPGPSDFAAISNGYVIVDTDQAVAQLDFTGGEIRGGATLTVNSLLNWTGGAMKGTGATTAEGWTLIAEGATCNVDTTNSPGDANRVLLDGRNLENAGIIIWTGTDWFSWQDGAVLTNRAGALFEARSDAYLAHTTSGHYPNYQPRFDNAGIFRKSAGTGTTIVSGLFNNWGTVDVQTGEWECRSTLTNSGTLAAAEGAVVTLALPTSSYVFTDGAQLIGDGIHRVPAGRTIAVVGEVVAHNLDLRGELLGLGTLHITGAMTWPTGKMLEAGRTVIEPGATLSLNGTNWVWLDGRALENAGTIKQVDKGELDLLYGAIITNRPGALIDLQTNAVISLLGLDPSPRIDNAGLFRKSNSAGTSVLAVSFNNYGTNEVQSGTLQCILGFTNYGRAIVAAGATHQLASGGVATGIFEAVGGGLVEFTHGVYSLNAGAQLIGGGLHRINDATLSVDGSVTAQNLEMVSNSAVLTGSGTMTVTETLNWTRGTMSGSGRTVIAEGATCDVGSTDNVGLNPRTFENAGKVNWIGSAWLAYGNGAVITNRPSGVFEAQSDAYLAHAFGAAPHFDNAGTFRKSPGTGVTKIGGGFNNYGTVDVKTGTLEYVGAFTNHSLVIMAAGATHRLTSGGSATGVFEAAAGGLVEFTSGIYHLMDGAQFIGAGLHRINGGSLSVNGNVSAENLELASNAAVLTGPGTMTVTGTLNWTRGTMNGPGRTVIAEGATCNIGSTENVGLGVRTLENAGKVNWTGSAWLAYGDGALITNRPSGVFEAQSDAYLAHAFGAAPRFDNAGTFRKSPGTGISIIGGNFNNYGTNEVLSGTLQLNAGYTYIQYAGRTSVCGGGNIANASPLQILAGEVGGSGIISGSVNNPGGAVSPGCSPGQLTIGGAYTQGANGTLDIELAGNIPGTSHDRLAIGGAATLGGSLEVKLTDDFYPNTNALFTFLTTASRSGNFSSFYYPSNDVGLKVTNTPTSFSVEVINVRPVLAAIPDQTNDEMTVFSHLAAATDDDRPAQTLTYSLTNSPAGASINPSTGLISWTPTEAQGPMTTNITVRVTDNGIPNLTVSRTFAIVINEVNVAPALTLPPDTNVNELVHFTATATATDSDIPTNALTFALVSGPEGLTVSTNGVIEWTPNEAQGPSTNTVYISVTDTNSIAVNEKSLSVTNSFQIVVNEVNLPPVLTVPSNRIITEQTTLAVSASATDPDLPANPLTFALISPPAGMVIDPNNCAISWTPAEDQGPTTNTITVVATDDSPLAINAPHLSVTNTFIVTVTESNQPPVLILPANTNINELIHFTVTATATDADMPGNPLTFALVSGPPGLTVSTSGEVNWTPDESQGPSTNTVAISVSDTNPVALNGTSLSVTSSFEITVQEVNVAPVLGLLNDYIVNAGRTVSFTVAATDSDVPANSLSFSLLSPPTGATITSGGSFSWRPVVAVANTTNVVRLRVEDNGAPATNDTRSFQVIVNPLTPTELAALGFVNGQFTLGVTGPLGPDYVIMGSTNLQHWSDLTTNPAPALPFQHIDPQAGAFSNRAYRVRLQP